MFPSACAGRYGFCSPGRNDAGGVLFGFTSAFFFGGMTNLLEENDIPI
jgi:hypothetical protein